MLIGWPWHSTPPKTSTSLIPDHDTVRKRHKRGKRHIMVKGGGAAICCVTDGAKAPRSREDRGPAAASPGILQ